MADGNTIELKIKLLDDATGAVRDVSAQVEGLAEAVRGATGAAEGLTGRMLRLRLGADAVRGVADSLSALTAPSRDFDDAMRKANTMAGLSEEQFMATKRALREISREVPLSGAALAEGLYAVVSNGFAAGEQLDVLRASAHSAVGGCADLSKVVGVTATMIKNYGLRGDEAAAIQDKIQLTAQNGVTSFEELAAALPMVTANAATLGVSIDELMASYATLTGVSGNTAAVSTQLGAIFTALSKPTTEASRLAAEMGVRFDAAAIRAAGGLQSFLSGLSAGIDAYAAKSGTLRETIAATLFGSAEAIKAFTPMTGGLRAKFAENVEAMRGSAGAMYAAFAQMEQTSGARAQGWANLIGGVTDAIQEKMGGVLTFVQGLFSAVGSFSSAMPALGMLPGLMGKAAAAARSAAAVAGAATAGAGRIRRVDITIGSVVENFTVSTTNVRQGAESARDIVARALADAVNDVNYAP